MRKINLLKINERLWCCIQEVNVRAKGIILSYVIVRRVYKIGNNQIRIVINNLESKTAFNELTDNVIDIDELSHLINFKTTSPQRKIMVSDDVIPGNARMIIDKEDQLSAAVDIFLDISIHSLMLILFLETYYSFAFLARIDGKNLDYFKYIDLWKNFILSQYASYTNDIMSIVEQLNFYKDIENLDKEYLAPEYWNGYKGDYLLLRINREPNTNA